MRLEADELLAAVEALVFVASEPLTAKRLREAFPGEAPEDVDRALERLARLHEGEGRGLALDRVAGGYRIVTRPAVHEHVARFIQQERAERLSMRTLETLSVIAYKQPVTAADVGQIRGVDPTGTVKTLLDKGLVKVVGRKKVVGRPFVYGTTKAFLTTFGLDELADLPTLKELEDFATDVPTTDPSEVEPPDGPDGGRSPDGAPEAGAATDEPYPEAGAATDADTTS